MKEKTFEELPAKQLAILEKNNLDTYAAIRDLLPRKYKDFRLEYTRLCEEAVGKLICLEADVLDVTTKSTPRKMTKIRLQIAGCVFYAYIFGGYNPYQQALRREKIAIWGTLLFSEDYGYSIMQPDFICPASEKEKYKRILPVYKKFRGITEDTIKGLIATSLLHIPERVPEEELKKYGFTLPSSEAAYRNLHNPTSTDLEPFQKRIKFDKLYHFATEMTKQCSLEAKGTPVILNKNDITRDILDSLPYELTEDQKKYFKEIINQIKDGRRADVLLQGDVGCGKTMVAILLLFILAENGYQGAIMAPTSILAKQHFSQIEAFGKKYKIPVAFLDGATKQGEKKKIYAGVESGEIKILVGTHSLTNSDLKYHNLGIVIIDEEHRFGVEQRNALLSHAEHGVNTVVMSATPMPRTIAGVLHGNNTEIMDIHTMPADRLPIKTAINSNDTVITDFIERQLAEGRQAYVICPLIEDAEEESVISGIRSLNQAVELYEHRFEPFYHVRALNGQMSASEMEEIIGDFAAGKIDVLISTTVVEVGVNVPNATVMVISNAERFGLAAMHQLRGRVGRGKYQSYCILQSTEKENPRLKAMVNHTNGFEIAKMDLELRGAGDLIGVKQSGFSEVMDLIMEDPKFYDQIRKMAEEKKKEEWF